MSPLTRRLRVGVLGAGTISEFHLAAYAEHPDVELVAVADVDAERAQARAAQFGVARASASAQELIADPGIDALSICTRNDTHVELAVAALAADKSVLVEKPMGRTVAEAEAVVAAEEASAGVVQVGYVRRWSPNAAVLKSFVDAGDLGEVYYAKATCLRRAGNPGGWFADRSVSGGGPLIDVGVHFIDIAWWLMGAPRAVTVSGFTADRLGDRRHITTLARWTPADAGAGGAGGAGGTSTVEDLAGALVRFEGGAVLALDVSYSLHGRDEVAVKLFGERGGAELEPELRLVGEAHGSIVETTPVVDSRTFEVEPAFRAEVAGFVRAARGEEPSTAPARHGLEMARIITAVYDSAARGREVTL